MHLANCTCVHVRTRATKQCADRNFTRAGFHCVFHYLWPLLSENTAPRTNVMIRCVCVCGPTRIRGMHKHTPAPALALFHYSHFTRTMDSTRVGACQCHARSWVDLAMQIRLHLCCRINTPENAK